MELEFHGGASEVGRSCIEVKSNKGKRYLFDVGVKFGEKELLFPENVFHIETINGVFLSHAHLDHSGGLPLFEHNHLKGPIFCTRQTLEISKILLKDSYKVARIKNLHPAYNNTDLKEIRKNTKYVKFDKWYKHEDAKFMFLNAGHIPGSAMILLELDGKRILYTGDFNNRKSALMFNEIVNKELLRKKVDVLITESTYGYRDLPERENLEQELIESIKKTLAEGGSIIIPVFALGRAQEILIMLAKHKLDTKIYVDGMCNKITRKILSTPSEYVDNKKLLGEAFYEKAEWIGSPKRRKDAMKNQGIFVTTSGMLQGGPVLTYLKEMWHNEKNKIILTGYQCKNSNGRHLLEEGYIYIDGWKTTVKCKVEKYDFSGHADRQGILRLVKTLDSDHIIFQHGDPESVNYLKEWAEKNLRGKAYAPKNTEKIIIE